MNARSPFNAVVDAVASLALFSERRDGSKDGAPISDETYERIPDKFKSPTPDAPKRDDAKRRREEPPRRRPPLPQPERRSPLPNILLALALVSIGYFVYQSFFLSKTTEITWTAFNAALDADEIETANLKGNRLVGELREIPALDRWAEVVPNGKKTFERLISQFDRSHPEKAQEFQDALSGQKLTTSVKKAADGSVEVALKDGDVVLRARRLPSDATEEAIETARRDLAQNYELGFKIAKRWTVKPLDQKGSAVELIDVVTKKRAGVQFHKKYVCEAPAFAFSDQTIDARLRSKLDSYTSTTPQDGSSLAMLLSIGVSIIFLVLIFRMMRRANEQMMGGGGGGFGAFTKSLAKRYEPDRAKRVTFADAAGMDAVKAELIEIVDYLKNPAKYERMGARVPKGTLLFGPPGTGKTLLARAVAGEANVPFYSINGSEFIQMFVGVGASRVRDIFATAKENAPSILFIDEIDAVGRQRGAGVGGGQDEREQTLNQILSEMDGFAQNDSVMVMASTNRPDVLDPALMRPGRFDRHITVGRPSLKGRVEIFNVYLKKIPLGADVSVDALAKKTVGFTGADIRNFVNEATLWATRNNKNEVNASDFDFAFEKIQMGLKRDEIVSPKEKRKTAYHEAGHALIGWFLPVGSTVHKITIVPRGRSLGATWFLPEDDKLNYNESEVRATLARFLAGRAAEKLVYDETSAGAENDLKRATDLARDMIVHWGMSERLGPVAFRNSESHPFLGREMTNDVREYSEETARVIDEEIVRVMREADETARNLIIEKRELFEALTDALVAEEELDYDQIVAILGPMPKEADEDDVASSETETPTDAPASPVSSDATILVAAPTQTPTAATLNDGAALDDTPSPTKDAESSETDENGVA
ncbi:MAG: ATP-dependent zinc metalloprotease FtsH [Thermoguttaceae bacterium]|nr:ATP-dependent zinc metalloprotease FtsH [Thermoguttaceae bacterium]